MDTSTIKQLVNIVSDINIQMKSIAQSVHGIDSNVWTQYGVIVSLVVGAFAALAAVYSANRDIINGLFWTPKIECTDSFTIKQASLLISRVAILNSKKAIARNVSFWVENIYYIIDGTEVVAENFIPFPLRWTHKNTDEINLYYLRPYNLDLCEIHTDGNGTLQLSLSSHLGSPRGWGVDDMLPGTNELLVKLYCDNYPIMSCKVTVRWNRALTHPDITIGPLRKWKKNK